MDPIMDVIRNSEEPEWLEKTIVGGLRVWQIIFLCLGGLTALIVMVCCCFRFRIPRTKQQIEADYKRRQITTKFRHRLETIQDSQMDTISLKDALVLLQEKNSMEKPGSQGCSPSPPQIFSGPLDASLRHENGQKPEPQISGGSFVKFATKVAHISKFGQPASPTSPPSDTKMDF